MKLHYFLLFILVPKISFANLCQSWSQPQKIGELDIKLINESSGMIQSKNYDNRLYHHNDSGGGAYFFITNLTGGNTQKVNIQNHKAVDIEDIATGPCYNNDSCLFIADIGDNSEVRKQIQIVVIREEQNFAQTINADHIVHLKYPDKAHNAEAVLVNSLGNLFIITKEFTNQKSAAAKIFKLNADLLNTPNTASTPYTLEHTGDLDITQINKEFKQKGQIVTGADIKLNDHSFVVLTYENAIEFFLDLEKPIPATDTLIENQDYKKIPFTKFAQQESITYTNEQNAVLVTTESVKKSKAPIIKMSCLDSKQQM